MLFLKGLKFLVGDAKSKTPHQLRLCEVSPLWVLSTDKNAQSKSGGECFIWQIY